MLNDVWFVPEVSKNLFSVLSAQDRLPHSLYVSTATECWLKVNGVTVLYGTRSRGQGLFKAKIRVLQPDQPEINVAAKKDVSALQLYHARFGHQDRRHVRDLLMRELNIKANDSDFN